MTTEEAAEGVGKPAPTGDRPVEAQENHGLLWVQVNSLRERMARVERGQWFIGGGVVAILVKLFAG